MGRINSSLNFCYTPYFYLSSGKKWNYNFVNTKRFYATKPDAADSYLTFFSENPFFLTAFVDAEGSFMVSITRSSRLHIGWSVIPIFAINLHIKDLQLLEGIKAYLGGGGNIRKNGKNMIQYTVSSMEHLNKIIAHFDRYPLSSQKKADFDLFKETILIIKEKGHLTPQGLQKIINIRASLNNGLTETLREAFPQTVPVVRPILTDQMVPHPSWVAGFTTGEGCFFIRVKKATTKIGVSVGLMFQLTQHSRDEQLMRSLTAFFGCGNYVKREGYDSGDFKSENFADIYGKIIPFFITNGLGGIKALEFQDWKEAAEIINNKDHLTEEGLNHIIEIKARMNKGR